MHFSVKLLVFFLTVNGLVADFVRFRKVPSYDNLVCSVTLSWSFAAASTSRNCAVLCSKKADCVSFFYKQETGSCKGIGDILLPDPATCDVSTGNSFYRMEDNYIPCGDDTDCSPENNLTCSDGRCKCIDFYQLVPDQRVCVSTCQAYGDTFEVYPGIRSTSYLLQFERPISYAACQQHCTDRVVCRSFSYMESWSKPCWVSMYTLLQLPENMNNYTGAAYAQRNCA